MIGDIGGPPQHAEVGMTNLLDIFNGTVGSAYAAAEQQFVGAMPNARQLDSMRTVEANRRNNFSLVTGLVKLLPCDPDRHASEKSFVPAEDGYEARMVGASVLWVAQFVYPDSETNKSTEVLPYYIVGERDDPAGLKRDKPQLEAKELLLVEAAGHLSHRSVRTAKVWKQEFEPVRDAAVMAIHSELPSETLDALFDQRSQNLHVTAAHGMRTALAEPGLGRYRRNGAERVAREGMHITTAEVLPGDTAYPGIDDDAFVTFGTPTRLLALATGFRVVSGFRKLTEAYDAQRKTSIDEQMLREG